MSAQITEAFVQEFSSNIYMLSQQKGSKLRPFVRQETIHGKSKALDRIGTVDVVEKVGRHTNTPQLDTPHSRRWIFLKDYEWADLIDDLDKVRILNDPTSEYVMAAAWSMGRTMDAVILAAADMVVKTGEDAGGTVTLPNSQRLAASNGSAFTNLNVKTLIAIKSKFGINDIDGEIPLHIAVNQRQIDGLLADNQVTSADYATVKALVRGDVDSYLGFQFHRTNKVLTESSAVLADPASGVVGSGSSVTGFRKVVAWAQDGLILGIGADTKQDIGVRKDKSLAMQAYMSMAIGSTRMEEEKVVIAYCKET